MSPTNFLLTYGLCVVGCGFWLACYVSIIVIRSVCSEAVSGCVLQAAPPCRMPGMPRFGLFLIPALTHLDILDCCCHSSPDS